MASVTEQHCCQFAIHVVHGQYRYIMIGRTKQFTGGALLWYFGFLVCSTVGSKVVVLVPQLSLLGAETA